MEYNENDDRYQLLLTLTQFLVAAFETNKENRDENRKKRQPLYINFLFLSRCVNNNFRVMQEKIFDQVLHSIFAPVHNASHIFPAPRNNTKKAPSLQKSFKELTFYYYSLVF